MNCAIATKNRALSPDVVGGEGWGEGALSDDWGTVQVRGVSPLTLCSLTRERGREERDVSRAARATTLFEGAA